ncbi:MAG: hypothetical protein H6555_05550 [Lewinellaceae bacterium]|nr:hypothetical protein [Lewinellaceae bacterium]
MRNFRKSWFLLTVLIVVASLVPFLAEAQCPMCRIAAESNLKNGGTDGQGLNLGILYMLATPYLLIGGLGYWWYRNRKKQQDDPFAASETEQEEQ